MPRKATTADDVSALDLLMDDLEERLRRSADARRDGASPDDAEDFLSGAFADVMKRLGNGAGSFAGNLTDEAARIGGDTVKRIVSEIEQRPLAMLAIAAGIGYLLGMTRR
jgi:ElaB/YqjD/DUF883 family membrane-anchored ribosome-binding protein